MSTIFTLKQTLCITHYFSSKFDLIILLVFNYALIIDINCAVNIDKYYNDSIVVNWNKSIEILTGYNLTVENSAYSNLNHDEMKVKIKLDERGVHLEETNPPLKIDGLHPGMTYKIEFGIQLKNGTTDSLYTLFTARPNVPRQLFCYHDKNDLVVQWRRPDNNPIFERYLVTVKTENWSGSPEYVGKDEVHWLLHFRRFANMSRQKAYKAVVQTISRAQASEPVQIECPIAPDPPSDVMVDPKSVTPYSFEIHWNPPKTDCKFDAYKVGIVRLFERNISSNQKPLSLIVSENIRPGQTYHIFVATISESVHFSKPKSVSVTTPPLPVLSLNATPGNQSDIYLEWTVDQNSTQDSYTVIYRPVDRPRDSTQINIPNRLNSRLTGLIPGCNYSINVTPFSNGVNSKTSLLPIYQTTRPLKPKFDRFEPLFERHLNVSWLLTNKNSRIEYFEIVWTRVDNKETNSTKIHSSTQKFVSIEVYPGANYILTITSVSYGLVSECDQRNYTVEPHPPTDLEVNRTSTSMSITWSAPQRSLVDNYIIKLRFSIRDKFQPKTITNLTYHHFDNLENAKMYAIRVVSTSNGKESIGKSEIPSLYSYSKVIVTRYQNIGSMENITKLYDKIMLGEEENANNIYVIVTVLIVSALIVALLTTLIISNRMRKSTLELEQINMNSLENTSLILNENDHDSMPEIDESITIKIIDIEIQNEIGHGQFGTVYSGILSTLNGRLKIRVAIKKLRTVPDQDYFREAIIMKNFNHANVINLIGVSIGEDGYLLVVLPFMEKGDLHSYLVNEQNDPKVGQMLKFGIDVALGMEYLSSKNLVHRDLAARNCMLDNDLCVKVADFGLTRNLYENDYYRSENMFQRLPIRWMSIESLEKGVYNTKTDVWSYGVFMWEVLIRGVIPYHQLNINEVFTYIKSGKRLERPLQCPQIIYEMLCLCWSVEPSNRPTFALLAQRLEAILADPHTLLKFDTSYYNNPVMFSHVDSNEQDQIDDN